MKHRVQIPFDKTLCIQQSWQWWRHAWREHFREQKSRMLLGGIGSLGFTIAMLISNIGYAPIFAFPLAFFAFLLLRSPFSYLLSKFQHGRSLRKIEADQKDVLIEFDAGGIRICGEDYDDFAKWADIICYGTVENLLVIYIEDPREPHFFSRSEVPPDFYDALLSMLEAQKEAHSCWSGT